MQGAYNTFLSDQYKRINYELQKEEFLHVNHKDKSLNKNAINEATSLYKESYFDPLTTVNNIIIDMCSLVDALNNSIRSILLVMSYLLSIML